ncbi:MAG: ABC transporter permease [Roseibium sp.]|uniref:ABC transporter permease n=1 Tax=Roseibium sp. TaxID=1936156 RepID=UPI001B274F53|nr:ABC transporter permease [Roseibium sp.]MBO6894809.1 ABC transporter permease [Roseibium sp.]MBO6930382.1 ABC transporter permease [Roseibium sp.]
MLAFIIRRLGQALLVLMAVGFVSFSMFKFMGDPLENMLGQEATVADRAELEERLGLNDPIIVQYFDFFERALRGDFGVSYRVGLPVGEVILDRLPATLELAFLSGVFAISLGFVLGVYTAIKRDGFLANFIMTTSLIGVSLPTFLIGVFLIWAFSVNLGWLPSFGRGETRSVFGVDLAIFTWDGLRSMILPAVTLGLYQMTLIMRLVRSEMLEVLRTDYIRFARARGLSQRTVNFGHAMKNTLVPVITVTGLQFGSIVAFAIITESVFQWPGVGLLFINAVSFVDIPVMSAYLLLVGVIFVTINLIVDLLYFTIDPRLSVSSN